MLYAQIRQPPVSSNSFWTVYLQLINAFRTSLVAAEITQILDQHQQILQLAEQEDNIQIPSHLRELRNGDRIVGLGEEGQHVGGSGQADGGQSAPIIEYATFTDEDSLSDSGASN